MSNHDRTDRYFKWFLVFAAVYFVGHILIAAVRGISI